MAQEKRQAGRLEEELVSAAIVNLEAIAAQQANADLNAVVTNLKNGQIIESESVFRSVAVTYEETEGVGADHRAGAYINLAAVCWREEPEKVLEALGKAVALHPASIKAHALLSHRYLLEKKLQNAAFHATKAREQDDPDKLNQRWQFLALEDLAVIAHVNGEFDKAEANYRSAIEGFEQIGDERGAAEAMGNLALILRREKKFDQAEPLLVKSLETWTKLDFKEEIIRTQGYLASVYFMQEKFAQSIVTFAERAKINQQLGETAELAADYANMGSAYIRLGKQEEACSCWQQAIRLYQSVEGTNEIEVVSALLNSHGCAQPA